MDHATPGVHTGSGRVEVAVLTVQGMHCASCVTLVEETLVEDLGVPAAEVDLDAGRATVTFDPDAHTVEDLCAAVAAAGYTAAPARSAAG